MLVELVKQNNSCLKEKSSWLWQENHSWEMSARRNTSLLQQFFHNPELVNTQTTIVLCQHNTWRVQRSFAHLTFNDILNVSICKVEFGGLHPPKKLHTLCTIEHNRWEQRERTADSLLMPTIGWHRAAETASKSEGFGGCIKMAYKVLIVPILEWKVCFLYESLRWIRQPSSEQTGNEKWRQIHHLVLRLSLAESSLSFGASPSDI